MKPRFVAAYAGMVLGGVALFLLIRRYGEGLVAPGSNPAAPSGPSLGAPRTSSSTCCWRWRP